MKIAILGAGALGCGFGARLTDGGHDVTLVDTSPAVVHAIAVHGVRIAQADRERSVPVAIRADPLPEVQDLMLLLVKRPATTAALEANRRSIGDQTIVASLQNGLGTVDVLRRSLPPDRVVAGVTYTSSTSLGLGHVAWTPGRTLLGSPGGIAPAETVAGALRDAGCEADAVLDVDREIWSKVSLNCAGNPVAALTGLTMSELLGEPPAIELADALIRETVLVAAAAGIQLDADERIERHHAVLAGGGKSSMLQDVDAGRPTEIDSITGELVAAADRLGIDTPLNRAVLALVKGRERAARRRRPDPPRG